MSLLWDPTTYAIVGATLAAIFILVKIHLLRCVVFDVKELHACVKKGVGKVCVLPLAILLSHSLHFILLPLSLFSS